MKAKEVTAMKIAICDDSAVDRDYTAGMVEAWARDREISLILRKFPSAGGLLVPICGGKRLGYSAFGY